MNARNKLNTAYFLGSLILASIVGWLTGSWLLMLIGLAVLVGVNVNNGQIRGSKRRFR
jgi:hypothetical protein